MDNIISNIIVWTVVLLIVGNLKSKAGTGVGKTKSESDSKETYVIEYGKVLKIIMTIGLLFFGLILFINIATHFWGWNLGKGIDLGTVIFFGIVFLFYIATFSGVAVWKIKVDGEYIYYRNYLGIWKKYSFLELDKIIKTKKDKIIVYCRNKRIFSIDDNVGLGIYLIISARKYNVKTEQKQ